MTNICKNLGGFCGFAGQAVDDDVFYNDKNGIQRKSRLTHKRGETEIFLLIGVHPDFSIDTDCDIIFRVLEKGSSIHLHAFSPYEVGHTAPSCNLSTAEVLSRRKSAGLGSLQGICSRNSRGFCTNGTLSQKTEHSRVVNDLRGTMFPDESLTEPGYVMQITLIPVIVGRMATDLERMLKERTTLYRPV